MDYDGAVATVDALEAACADLRARVDKLEREAAAGRLVMAGDTLEALDNVIFDDVLAAIMAAGVSRPDAVQVANVRSNHIALTALDWLRGQAFGAAPTTTADGAE